MKKKIVITNKKNFIIIKKLMTKEDFHAKFDVSMSVVTSSLADKAMLACSVDSKLASAADISLVGKK